MTRHPDTISAAVRVIAIDSGPARSALVVFESGRVTHHAIMDNAEVLKDLAFLRGTAGCVLVVEMIASYGMAVGAEVFETCVWIGRFVEAWGEPHERMFRRVPKLHLCNSAKAKDANVRQALIDRFGGKKPAIGSKKLPGPLYGIHGDEWAALACAVTYTDERA